jgi:2,5-diketo-D-gluconate reductase A
MGTVPAITLNNGVEIPQIGLGVWQIPDGEVEGVIATALDLGYRSIDTAKAYNNETGVGNAIAAADLPREELFITTKLANGDQGYDSTLRAFEASMARLRLDVLDLYLIHWPCPSNGQFAETWRAFEHLHGEGRIRAIGVSNFRADDLQALFDEFGIVPAVNQVELHPDFQQAAMRALHTEHGIATEAWSPLGHGAVLGNPAIAAIADRHRKTPAQVVLRWQMQVGAIAIPKSASPARLAENIAIFDFALSDDDLAIIAGLETGVRIGGDPAVVAMPAS